MTAGPAETDAVVATAELVRRMGATSFAVRYSDDDRPIVWLVVAEFGSGRAEAAGAMTPELAADRLAAELLDGGSCASCGRPTAALEPGDEQFAGLPICAWSRQGKRYTRSCAPLD